MTYFPGCAPCAATTAHIISPNKSRPPSSTAAATATHPLFSIIIPNVLHLKEEKGKRWEGETELDLQQQQQQKKDRMCLLIRHLTSVKTKSWKVQKSATGEKKKGEHGEISG